MKPLLRPLLLMCLLLGASPALADSTILGLVLHAETKKAVAGVEVTATSPALKGERTTLTDSLGQYRFAALLPGSYTLRFRKPAFQAHARTDVRLRENHFLSVNVELVPEAPRPRPEARGGTAPVSSLEERAPVSPNPLNAPNWALPHMILSPFPGSPQPIYRANPPAERAEPPPGQSLFDSYLKGYGVNPTIDTEEERFSTFSLVVGTGAYALTRSYLERGALPEAPAVRVEEFINTFDYGYAGEEGYPLGVYVEGFPSPSRKGYHVVRLGLKAPGTPRPEGAARDVRAQVEFDRRVVSRYRLLGYENRPLAPEQFTDDRVDTGELAPGDAVTVLYEVKLRDPSAEAFGTLRLRYQEPTGGGARVVETKLLSSTLRAGYASASPAARLAWVASAFAEKLRGGYWVRPLSYEQLHGWWEKIGEPLSRRPDVVELGALISQAQTLDQRTDRFELLSPVNTMDFDRVPSILPLK